MKFNGISLLKSRFNYSQQALPQSISQVARQSEKMVQLIAVGGEYFTVSGHGYYPQGNIYRDRHAIDPWQFQGLEECLIAGILCNNAQLVSHVIEHRQQSITIGNPYEGALLALAQCVEFQLDDLAGRACRIAFLDPAGTENCLIELAELPADHAPH